MRKIGIALGGAWEGRSRDLLRKADLALYRRAKSRGKDSYELFVTGLENKIEL